MATDSHATDSHGDEEEFERLNRELDQLLSELRVALPGVQVLLAFLLTVPFSQRFDKIGATTRNVYFAAVLLTALASILLIAPTVQHRLRFRAGIKAELIHMTNRLAIVGLACMALAIAGSVYVVGAAAFPDAPARWAGPGFVAVAGYVWFVLPFRYRSRRPGKEPV